MAPQRKTGLSARKGLARKPSPAALANARAELAAAGFTEAGLRERFGLGGGQPLRVYFSYLADPLLAVSGAPTSLELLVALFLQGAPVERARLEEALSSGTIGTLLGAGLLRQEGRGRGRRLRSPAALFPLGDLYLAADPHDSRGRPDHVFFPDDSTAALLNVLGMIEEGGPRGTAVDVGAGAGTVALVAAQRGWRRVIAVEPNPRAVALARRNAWLNDLPVEVRRGTLEDARRAFRGVDLFTFVLPRVFGSAVSSLAYQAREGASLVDATYAAIGRMLSPEGRAVVFHQARTAPRHDVERILEDLPGLQAVFCPTSPLAGLEFGAALVRRRRPDEPGFARVPDVASGGRAGAAALAGYLETRAVLERGEGAALRSVPYVPGHVAAVRWFFSFEGRLVRTPTITLGEQAFPRQALGLLRRCDGRRTLAEVLRRPEDEPPALPDLARSLIDAGQLYLRPR